MNYLPKLRIGTLCLLVFLCALQTSVSAQPVIPQSVTTGYVDPTVATANSGHPLVACTSSCSTALVNQNTDALNWAVLQAAAAPHPWIFLPPGTYPYARGGTSHNQIYGVVMDSVQYVTWVGYGAKVVQTGDLGGSDFYGFRVQNNSAHIRFYGIYFSQLGMTHVPTIEQSHNIQLGDGSQRPVDDIQVIDCVFDEGYGGDSIRLLGGADESTSVTRVVVTQNRINGKRDGLSFQHGSQMLDNYGNYYGPTRTLSIHHEPTSPGGNNYENHVGNFISASTGPTAISLGGEGLNEEDGVHDSAFAFNIIPNGYQTMLEVTRQYWYIGNIDKSFTPSGDLVLDGQEFDHNIWVEDNVLEQHSTFGAAVSRFVQRNNAGPQNIWYVHNRVSNYSCPDAVDCGYGFTTQGAAPLWVERNDFSYNSVAAPSGANGGGGANSTSGVDLYGSNNPPHALAGGWYLGNVIRRGFQADGVTLAGQMAIGLNIQKGGAGGFFNGIGHAVVRDNTIDGAATAFQTSIGASQPEGYPLYTSNILVNDTADGYPTNFVTETVPISETLTASGTAGPSKFTTFVGPLCGTTSIAVPNGVRDGEPHTFEVNTTCGSAVTFTFSGNCADCSAITVTTTSPLEGAFSIVWDATSGTYRRLDQTSNVTVTP